MLSLPGHRGDAGAPARHASLAAVTTLLVCSAPLFVLVLRGWSSAVLFLGAALSLFLLLRAPPQPLGLPAADRRWMWAVIAAFAAPLLATAISAALRADFFHRQFDAPSRFLLGIPVFLFVLRSRMPVGQALQWVLPAALLLALGVLEVQGRDRHWPPDRHTTHAVNPLVFGYLALAFGLMCLLSLKPRDWRPGNRWRVLVRLAGLALGLYLSARSGTRTGWLALPIVLGVWLHHHWGRGHRLASAGALVLAALVPLAAYLLVPAVGGRVDEAVAELRAYTWDGVPPETSLGLRITYLRIAADLIALHPLAGIGDLERVSPERFGRFDYASDFAVAHAIGTAFHNQVVTNTVRYGLSGLLATAALLLVPLLLCARALRAAPSGTNKDAAMGLAFTTCLAVSSLSTEVVDLKSAASFYTVMVAALCGAALARSREQVPVSS